MSTAINANEYSATNQAITDAIDRSVSHSEIVTILAHGHESAVCEDLERECEGSVEADGVSEYWGTDCDGESWRVHVRR